MNNLKIMGLGILIIFISCKINNHQMQPTVSSKNYINYYNRVYQIDSLLRFKKDTIEVIKQYHILFNEFLPKHTDFISEYETYILLSSKKNMDFGGKNSLKKLVPLFAPFWRYKKDDKSIYELYKKYGIDSIQLFQEIETWNEGLNKDLIDSFSIATLRDQELQRSNPIIQERNDKQNMNLLFWTFKNFGYPSSQKIGLFNEKKEFLKIGTIIHHMAGSKRYEEIREELLKYVRSGDCKPIEYATMVDRHQQLTNKRSKYGTEYMFGVKSTHPVDTLIINRNRKEIGLPSIKYHLLILNNN